MVKNKSTEPFQTMQASHENIRRVNREYTEKAIERRVSDHNKKVFPRKFKVGDMVQSEGFLTEKQKIGRKL